MTVTIVGARGPILDDIVDLVVQNSIEVNFVQQDSYGGGELSKLVPTELVGDISSVEQVTKAVKRLQRLNEVSSLISFTENALESSARTAEKLELATPFRWEVVNSTRNKSVMRSLLFDDDKLSLPFAVPNSLSQASKYSRLIGFPCIFKPISGTGSKGVSVVFEPKDVAGAFFNANADGCGVIVERFIEGREYSIETYSVSGKHIILAITSKHKKSNFVEIGHHMGGIPDQDFYNRCELFINDLFSKLKITDGCVHTEIIESDSSDLGIRLVEVQTRPGGDNLHRLVKLSYGFDLVAALCGAAESPVSCNCVSAGCAVAYWDSKQFGEVSCIPDFERIKSEFPGYVQGAALKKVGDYVEPTSSSLDRLGWVIFQACSGESAWKMAKKAISQNEFIIK